MTRKISLIFLLLLFMFLSMRSSRVNAQNSICSNTVSELLMKGFAEIPITPISGATIEVHQNVAGIPEVKNVIVVGQEPAEEGELVYIPPF
jgi:hypothetical protein